MICKHIEARDLPDSWFRAVYEIIQCGRKFKIDHGSYAGQSRMEFDYITINIKKPCFGTPPERVPDIPAHYAIPNPVSPDYVFGGPTHYDKKSDKPLKTYVEYLMTSVMEKNESYTYGQRLTEYPIEEGILLEREAYVKGEDLKPEEIINHIDDEIWGNSRIIKKNPINNYPGFLSYCFDQIAYAIWRYKKSGWRNNQITLEVGHPTDMLIKDPPCLRHIDTRIQDGMLHFIIYFRSWDLWNGYPANLAGLTILFKYMADEIGVETGHFICSSKGLHLYDYVWEFAEIIRGRTYEEFRHFPIGNEDDQDMEYCIVCHGCGKKERVSRKFSVQEVVDIQWGYVCSECLDEGSKLEWR